MWRIRAPATSLLPHIPRLSPLSVVSPFVCSSSLMCARCSLSTSSSKFLKKIEQRKEKILQAQQERLRVVKEGVAASAPVTRVAPSSASSSRPSSSASSPPLPPPPSSSSGSQQSSSGSSSSSSSSSSSGNESGSRRILRYAAIGGSVVVVASSLGLMYIRSKLDPDSPYRDTAGTIFTFSNALIRLWRDLYCTIWIVSDYEFSLRGLEGDAYKAKLKEIHLRSALRLRELMRTNGGIYIKVGQHLAQLQFLLPDEYVNTMKPMLNQAPTSTIEEVNNVFAEEFNGMLPTDVFETFDYTPIASASLAQVHFATLKGEGVDDGHGGKAKQVAVKIQHSALQRNCDSDIATVRFIIALVHWFDHRFNYNWLADEMAINLPLECNFVHEAQNSERTRRELNVDHRDDVAIPRVLWRFTSKRVLTMERMDGVLVTDVDALQRLDIDKRLVSTLMSQVFCEQIFIHGFVHCDPHGGNVFVQRRSESDNRPRLILLDHGLYRELSDEFRLNYAHLWDALIRGDAPKIKQYATLMNAGEMYALFASMLTRKPFSTIVNQKGKLDALVSRNDERERKQLQEWAVQYAEDVQDILARIPKPLLLLLKTNDCLRSVDTQLGTPINSFLITARFCTKAINHDRILHSNSFKEWVIAYADLISMEIRISFFSVMLTLAKWLQSCAKLLRFKVTEQPPREITDPLLLNSTSL